jgi:hypothetical protein
MAERFELSWRIEVDGDDAEDLAEALAPETGEHCELASQPGHLAVDGEGSAGESLHAIDDVLACLTGAIEALEATDEA